MKPFRPYCPFLFLYFSIFNASLALSENNELYDKLSPPIDNILLESEIDSNTIEVVEKRANPEVKPLMQEQPLNPLPYVNNYQQQRQQHVS